MATTINWPNNLPQFVSEDGYSRNPLSNVVRTSVSFGPAKTRRRTTKKIENLGFNIVMSKAQLDIFENFFDNTLGFGALSFNFPDPENLGSTIEIRFVTDQGAGYSITPESGGVGFFIVGFQTEIL